MCVPVSDVEPRRSQHSCVSESVHFANKAKRSLLCMDGRDANTLVDSGSAVRHSRTHSWRPPLFVVVIDALFIYLTTVSQRE